MGTTTQPTDFSDLYTDLMNRVRSDTSVTATVNLAKRYINIGLQDMHIGYGERFPWAERDAILVTHPVYSFDGSPNGGVKCTQGNDTSSWTTAAGTLVLGITLTNAYGQVNVRPGGKVLVSGGSEPYEIKSVTTGGFGDLTEFTSIFIQDTTATEVSFVYYEDEYDLASDFLRPLELERFASGGTNIDLIGRNEFRHRFPRDIVRGKPRIATIVDRSVGTITASTGLPSDTTPRRRIRFHPPPDDVYRIPYHYVTSNLAVDSTGTPQVSLSADSDEPIVPIQYRQLIVLHAHWHWLRDRHDDPTRAQQVGSEFESMLGRIASDVQVGQNRPQLRPRKSMYRRRSRRPWGSGGGRFDRGYFDYMGE